MEGHDSQTIRCYQAIDWLTLAGAGRSFQERLLMRILWGFAFRSFIHKVADALPHFSSRFIGEGKGQYFMGMVHLGQKSQETTGEQPSLSRTSWGFKVEAAVDIQCGISGFFVGQGNCWHEL